MSAIAGVLRTDGGAASETDGRALQRALGHRGMLDVASEGPVTLVGTLERVDDLLVTLHGDLDDAAATARALGLDRQASTGAIVLAAYRRWGADLARHLRGPLAFALWDPRIGSIVCVRDRLGVRPFAYHRGRGFAAFASEPTALFALPDVPAAPSETMIALALVDVLDDEQLTFWEGILRLPPASILVLGPEPRPPRRYWRPDASETLRLGSDDEYEEAFREAFVRAVARSTGSPGTVATELSGGLDSAAVTVVARDLLADAGPLHCVTAAFEGRGSDESAWVGAVLEQGGVIAHTIGITDIATPEAVDGSVAVQGEPFAGPTVLMEAALYRAARAAGADILLDGFDGDTVVSHGVGRLTDLLRSIRLTELAREVRAYAAVTGLPAAAIVRSEVVAPILPRRLLDAWRRHRGSEDGIDDAIVRPDVASRVDLRRRLAALERPRPRSATQEHALDLTAGVNAVALEIRDRAAAAAGIDLRHPFLDLDLVELCLAVPREQIFRAGVTRSLLRRALADYLPAEVLRRHDKGVLPPSVASHAARHHPERIAGLIDGTADASRYIDGSRLRGVAVEANTLLNAVGLQAWLEKQPKVR